MVCLLRMIAGRRTRGSEVNLKNVRTGTEERREVPTKGKRRAMRLGYENATGFHLNQEVNVFKTKKIQKKIVK